MSISTLLAEIDKEIATLQQAHALLSGASAPAKKTGRPAKAVKAVPATLKKKKRNLSPEGRARIAAAVKARWAKQKKAEK
jgi:hypothetical protein